MIQDTSFIIDLLRGDDGAATFLDVESYTYVMHWARKIDARAAVQRGRMVNRSFGEPHMQLHERHSAEDFGTRTQDKIGETA